MRIDLCVQLARKVEIFNFPFCLAVKYAYWCVHSCMAKQFLFSVFTLCVGGPVTCGRACNRSLQATIAGTKCFVVDMMLSSSMRSRQCCWPHFPSCRFRFPNCRSSFPIESSTGPIKFLAAPSMVRIVRCTNRLDIARRIRATKPIRPRCATRSVCI